MADALAFPKGTYKINRMISIMGIRPLIAAVRA